MNNPRARSGSEIRFDAFLQILCQYFWFEVPELECPVAHRNLEQSGKWGELGLNFAQFERNTMSIRL